MLTLSQSREQTLIKVKMNLIDKIKSKNAKVVVIAVNNFIEADIKSKKVTKCKALLKKILNKEKIR